MEILAWFDSRGKIRCAWTLEIKGAPMMAAMHVGQQPYMATMH
eukprot:COSAG06_NODE_45618_length_353_cov_0.905512_2_plen_42_part_01